jgi:hypothetical protein
VTTTQVGPRQGAASKLEGRGKAEEMTHQQDFREIQTLSDVCDVGHDVFSFAVATRTLVSLLTRGVTQMRRSSPERGEPATLREVLAGRRV